MATKRKPTRFGSLMGRKYRTPFVIRPFLGRVWLCVYSWGAESETPWGYLVLTWRHGWSLYLSPDATPQSAKWHIGRYRD